MAIGVAHPRRARRSETVLLGAIRVCLVVRRVRPIAPPRAKDAGPSNESGWVGCRDLRGATRRPSADRLARGWRGVCACWCAHRAISPEAALESPLHTVLAPRFATPHHCANGGHSVTWACPGILPVVEPRFVFCTIASVRPSCSGPPRVPATFRWVGPAQPLGPASVVC